MAIILVMIKKHVVQIITFAVGIFLVINEMVVVYSVNPRVHNNSNMLTLTFKETIRRRIETQQRVQPATKAHNIMTVTM